MHTLNFDMHMFITSKNGFFVWLYNIAKASEKKNGGQYGSTEEWVGYWLEIKMALKN
jgi:hypothetical protein